MARLPALPSLDIIHGFHGVIDFYLWKGLACARRWPRLPKSRQSPATRAAAATFGAMLAAYHLLGPTLYAAFSEDAKDQTRTPRDIWISALHGKLHEASMGDFLDLLTECRDFLSDLTALLNALGTVDTDDLQVDVKTSALPALAATAAHQVTQNTALATIAKLEAALKSVATDRFQIRGEDQLFTYKANLLAHTEGDISNNNGYFDSASPPPATAWKVTNIEAVDATSATTVHTYCVFRAPTNYWFSALTEEFLLNRSSFYHGEIWLDPGDVIRVYFSGGIWQDTCKITLTGSTMTLET